MGESPQKCLRLSGLGSRWTPKDVHMSFSVRHGEGVETRRGTVAAVFLGWNLGPAALDTMFDGHIWYKEKRLDVQFRTN
jgi:hypothetical protein